MLTVVEGRSTLTISSYESDLYALLEYLGGEDELLRVSSSKLDEYFAYLRSVGRKGSTVARAMSSARGYFRYLLDEGRLSVDPTARLAVATRGKSLPKALSEEYVNTLLASIDSTSALDIRDRLIVEFLYGTGARVSEMIDLKIQDVDLDEMLVRVTGKGSKQRLVPVGRHRRDDRINPSNEIRATGGGVRLGGLVQRQRSELEGLLPGEVVAVAKFDGLASVAST